MAARIGPNIRDPIITIEIQTTTKEKKPEYHWTSDDTITSVFRFLNARNLARSSLVCRQCRRLAEQDKLWRILLDISFQFSQQTPIPNGLTPKNYFALRHSVRTQRYLREEQNRAETRAIIERSMRRRFLLHSRCLMVSGIPMLAIMASIYLEAQANLDPLSQKIREQERQIDNCANWKCAEWIQTLAILDSYNDNLQQYDSLYKKRTHCFLVASMSFVNPIYSSFWVGVCAPRNRNCYDHLFWYKPLSLGIGIGEILLGVSAQQDMPTTSKIFFADGAFKLAHVLLPMEAIPQICATTCSTLKIATRCFVSKVSSCAHFVFGGCRRRNHPNPDPDF